jgi:phosphoserine phosphatase RsbX
MNDHGQFPALEYGVESVILPGERETGDMHVIKETSRGFLIGVIDGLGHGSEAANAARIAASSVMDHAEETIINIAKVCDERLRKTRGVVMALASLDIRDETITWLSIGNVEGILIRKDPKANPGYENIFMRPGVVGYHLPPLFASVFTINMEDMLILSTDGLRNDYGQRIVSDVRFTEHVLERLSESQLVNLSKGEPVAPLTIEAHEFALENGIDLSFIAGGKNSLAPGNLARYICKNYVKGSDDALVLVAKYSGRAAS